MKQYTLHVQGMHCRACTVLIEDIIASQPRVARAVVSLGSHTLSVEGDLPQQPEELLVAWSALLAPHRYTLSLQKREVRKNAASLPAAIGLGLLVLVLFFWLQKSGVLNFGFEGALTWSTALFIGVVASLSTCLALVGGLVLSLSARVSQDVPTKRPMILFHAGRLAGFAVLGGLLGLVGDVVGINATVTAALGLFAAVVMIILGLNLLDVLHATKRLQIALPRHFFDKLTSIEKGWWAPFAVGAGTFFLPCGFTQSMQFAALASGSFASGAVIMLFFAAGTLPVLAALSFGSFSFSRSAAAPLFFKTVGVVVVGLGLFALLSGLAGLGLIKPLFII